MLKYENVSVSCGHTPLLSNINLTVNDNTITTVIGPNGCGKTTLLRALSGSCTVTSGKIYIDDTDYLSLKPKKRAQLLSYLPQIRGTIPTLSVKTLTEHGRFPYLGFTRKANAEDYRIIENSMNLAGVSDYATQSVDTLSGGIRQRAYISMQLAQDSSYVIADEPTTYLDIPSQKDVISIYRTQKELGKTVILVLHDIAQALSVSDQIIVMKDRKIIAADTPTELLKQHIIEDVFGIQIKEFKDEENTYYLCV